MLAARTIPAARKLLGSLWCSSFHSAAASINQVDQVYMSLSEWQTAVHFKRCLYNTIAIYHASILYFTGVIACKAYGVDMANLTIADGLVSTVEIGTLKVQESLACRYSDTSFDELSDIEEEEAPPAAEPTQKTCKHSKKICISIYFCLALTCAGAFASVVVIGMVVGIPYGSTALFKETTCNAVQGSYMAHEMKCVCGKGCVSGYPCLEIQVAYTTPFASDISAQLKEDGFVLSRQVSKRLEIVYVVDADNQCTFHYIRFPTQSYLLMLQIGLQ